MKLYKTEEWHDDFGECIFFHFGTWCEPPEVLCSTPLSSDFEKCGGDIFWTHFIRLDFNNLIRQNLSEEE